MLLQANHVEQELKCFNRALHDCLNDSTCLLQKPSKKDLEEILKPLNNVMLFAQNLPGIEQDSLDHLEKMENSSSLIKEVLFEKWLSSYPNASWKCIANALVKCEQILSSRIGNSSAISADLDAQESHFSIDSDSGL